MIDQFLPGRRYVSDLKASRFSKKRVYATFDGHRSDDTMPHVFVSDDLGQTWTSLRNNLPDEAGSVRAILEDARNEDVLYLGTEHGIYASIDRGASWTRFNSNLPTVPVHDLAQHDLMGELVAGTHGRSGSATSPRCRRCPRKRRTPTRLSSVRRTCISAPVGRAAPRRQPRLRRDQSARGSHDSARSHAAPARCPRGPGRHRSGHRNPGRGVREPRRAGPPPPGEASAPASTRSV